MKPFARHAPVLKFSSPSCLQRPLLRQTSSSPPRSSKADTQHRHASTYRRSRKELNVPPAPAFGGSPLPTGSSGRSRTANQTLPAGDHIFFNPPSSAPNVYHTPPKFLPDSDPRKKLFETPPESIKSTPAAAPPSPLAFPPPLIARLAAAKQLTPAPITATGTNYTNKWPEEKELPPPVRPIRPKKYHLTPEDFEEMRRLRQSDEDKWTRSKLAEKFGCTQFFAGLVVQASEERLARLAAEEARYAYRWKERGGISMKTRLERQKRRAAWVAEA